MTPPSSENTPSRTTQNQSWRSQPSQRQRPGLSRQTPPPANFPGKGLWVTAIAFTVVCLIVYFILAANSPSISLARSAWIPTPSPTRSADALNPDNLLPTATPPPVATPRPTPTPTPTQSTLPFISIRMINMTQGWALTTQSVVKTADGGQTWQNVTPPKSALSNLTKGAFLNSQIAWLSNPLGETGIQGISIWHTTDGGSHWTTSTITTQSDATTDFPHFLNINDGWLQTYGIPGTGNRSSAVFHTIDGGQTWTQMQLTNTAASVVRTNGISLNGAQSLFITGDSGGGSTLTTPPLMTSSDDGQTAQNVQLPALTGAGTGGEITSTPPVFFGNVGILPVEHGAPNVLDLYFSYNDGKTWSTTSAIGIAGQYPFTVYVIDPQHAWAAANSTVYATTNGGQSWSPVGSTPQPIGEFSFVSTTNGWAIGQTPAQSMTQAQPLLFHTVDGGKTWQQIQYTLH